MPYLDSTPVIMRHVQRLQQSETPIDLLVSSFTLTGVGLLIGTAVANLRLSLHPVLV